MPPRHEQEWLVSGALRIGRTQHRGRYRRTGVERLSTLLATHSRHREAPVEMRERLTFRHHVILNRSARPALCEPASTVGLLARGSSGHPPSQHRAKRASDIVGIRHRIQLRGQLRTCPKAHRIPCYPLAGTVDTLTMDGSLPRVNKDIKISLCDCL